MPKIEYLAISWLQNSPRLWCSFLIHSLSKLSAFAFLLPRPGMVYGYPGALPSDKTMYGTTKRPPLLL